MNLLVLVLLQAHIVGLIFAPEMYNFLSHRFQERAVTIMTGGVHLYQHHQALGRRKILLLALVCLLVLGTRSFSDNKANFGSFVILY